jgi:NADPH-dependent 2,4-dienoyl-CoA reductase/sulfur reductase-like enzyme
VSNRFDIVVGGAGPGGLAAAATAAEAGMKVCLIDDNPAPGGQIWRSSVVKGINPAAVEWSRRLIAGQVEVRSGWRAVLADAADTGQSKLLRIENNGSFADLTYGALVVATGARERFLPFPGWTLPGVLGPGGLQAFVKSGFDVAGKRVVVAGTGPLLLAVAANLRAAGAHIVAIVEQAPMGQLAKFFGRVVLGWPGKLVEGAGFGLKLLGVPYYSGAWVARASGESHLRSVFVTSGGDSRLIETDLLAVGFHLVPNLELAQLIGCQVDEGYLKVDENQKTSVEGVYAVGEVTGIGGLEKALVEGRIAALAAAGRAAEASASFPERDQWMRFARALDSAFALRKELRELPEPDTIVCRCEDVTQEELGNCRSWREAKLHTRCGMGPCQGRICGPASQFLYGWAPPVPRPPIFSVEIQTLAEPVTQHNAHPAALP